MARSTQEQPVNLLDPTRPPNPAPGCDVCQALDRQRAAHEQRHEYGRATDCEEEIRRHPKHKAQP
ncbi:hypothetical protein [Streptomyces sp. NPDC051636]|uniref:hypothetical protein n=1 Tax=Streptomyces sp. NPDC051636 TaxID=3365663 RepID=UPI0037B6FCFE